MTVSLKDSSAKIKRGVLLIGFTVNCGKCSRYSETFPSVGYRDRSVILKSLKKDGWKQTSRHGWICFTCSRPG